MASDSQSPSEDAETIALIGKIREDFAYDGKRWSISHDQRLVHLWKKYQRTNDSLKEQIKKNQSLVSQRKKELAELEKFVQEIKNLNMAKGKEIESLAAENSGLKKQLRDLSREREAYFREHQAIADLIATEGLADLARTGSQSPVERLQQVMEDRVKYQTRCETTIAELTKCKQQKQELALQLDGLRSTLDAKEQMLAVAAEKTQEMTSLRQQLQTTIAAHDQIKKEYQVVNETLSAMQERYGLAQDKAHSLQEELESMMLENSASKQITHSLKDEVDSLSKALESKSEELSQTLARVEDKDQETGKMRRKLAEAQKFIQQLQSEASSESLQHQESIQLNRQKMSEIEASLFRKENEKQACLKQVTALTSELDTATKYHQELASKIESLEQQLKQESESLHSELGQKEGIILEMRQQIKSSQNKIDGLQALLSQAVDLEKERRQEILERDAQLATLDREMQQQVVHTEQQRREKQSAEQALEKSKAALQQLFQSFETLTGTLEEETNARMILLRDKIHNTQQALTRHSSLVDFWQSSMQEKQQTIISLRKQVQEAMIRHNQQDTEKQYIVQQLEEKGKEVHSVSQQKEELQHQVALLQEQLISLTSSEEATRTTHQQSLQRLRARQAELEKELRQATSREEQLSAELSITQSREKELAAGIQKSEGTNTTLSKKIATLEAELSSKQQMILSIQKKHAEEKGSMESELESLAQQQDSSNKQLQEMATVMDRTRKELQETTIKLSESQTKLLRSHQEKDCLITAVQTSKQSLQEQASRASQLEDQLQTQQVSGDEQQKQLASTTAELEAVKEQLKQMVKMSEEQKQRISNTEQTLASKTTECDQLSRKLTESKRECEGRTQSYNLVSDRAAQLEADLKEATRNEEELKQKLEELTHKLDSLQRHHITAEKQLEEKQQVIKNLEVGMESKTKESKQIESKKRIADAELTELKLRLQSSSSELQSLKRAQEESERRLELMGSLQEELACLKGRVGECDKELVTKETAMQNLNSELTSLRQKQGLIEETILEKQKSLDRLSTELQKHKQRNTELKDKLCRQKVEKQELQEEVEMLRKNITSCHIQVKDLTGKLESRRNKLGENKQISRDKLQSVRERYHKEKLSLASTVDQMSSELLSAQSQLTHEIQWRDHADNIHHQLLRDKTHLTTKIVDLEETMREKNYKIVEMEAIMRRLERENRMLQGKIENQLLHHSFTKSLTRSSPLDCSCREASLLDSSFSPRLNKTS